MADSGPGVQAARRDLADLWHTPQAIEWERLGWTREVARYARLLVASERPDANAAIHAQATALADRLGLTPKAMRLLLWTVADPAPTGGVLADMTAKALQRRGELQRRVLQAVERYPDLGAKPETWERSAQARRWTRDHADRRPE